MPKRVALVDADPARRGAVAKTLGEAGFEVVSAHDRADAAFFDDFDLIVAHVGGDVTDQLPELRVMAGPSAAILVVADAADLDRADEITAVGVRGLVFEPDEAELVAAAKSVVAGNGYLSPQAVHSVLVEVSRLHERDQHRNEELEELVRQLQDLSMSDGLTGLKKHGYFFERLDDELGRALRHRRPLSVAVGDIDDFRQVNDLRGHGAGDRVLQEVAAIVAAAVRTGDVVCRIGGEEFAMLLPETDAVGAELVADRVREQVGGLAIPGVGRVTMSLGVASAPEHAVDREALMEAAERALYLAKREGKNRTKSAAEGATVGVTLGSPGRRTGRNQIVDLLVRVLRLRDDALAEHAIRTADVAVALGAQSGLSTERLENLRVAALLQDVGKIGVPDRILHKRGPLTDDEWLLMKEHPKRGFELVGGLVHPEAAEAVLGNHERWDGKGYPRGVEAEEIPLLARVLLVADSYVAMTSLRVFQESMTPAEALTELRRHAGAQFDPDVVAAMGDLAAAMNLETLGNGELLPFPDEQLTG